MDDWNAGVRAAAEAVDNSALGYADGGHRRICWTLGDSIRALLREDGETPVCVDCGTPYRAKYLSACAPDCIAEQARVSRVMKEALADDPPATDHSELAKRLREYASDPFTCVSLEAHDLMLEAASALDAAREGEEGK